MISFAKFLQEKGPRKKRGYGKFYVEKDNVILYFSKNKAQKDGKDYIQFLSASPDENASTETKKKANYLNQFGQNCNFFTSKKYNHKSIDDVVQFLEDKPFDEIYNEISRLRHGRGAMFTKNDISFTESYNGLIQQKLYKIDKSGKIIFPLIEMEIQQVKLPRGYKNIEDYISEIQLKFEELAELKKYGVVNETESQEDYSIEDYEDNEESQKYKHEWQKREKLVKDNINSAIKRFKESRNIKSNAKAEESGKDSSKSDVIVQANDNNWFFVEVKLDYERAAYLKFNIRYDGENVIRTKNIEDEGVFNELFSKQMTKVLTANIKNKFNTLKRRIKFWINKFREVTKNNKNITENVLIDEKNIEKFPEAFDELAKAFNFFILEWTKKFQVCRSKYMYYILNNKDEEAQKIAKIANTIGRKIRTLSNEQEIPMLDAFQKFRCMYTRFISVEKTPKTKENRYVLFSFDTHEFDESDAERRNIATRDDILELIENYYRGLRNVEYIQVDDDLYKMNDKDPFNLRVPKFENLKGLYDISKQERSIIKMDVRIIDANTLHLDMRLTKPKRIKTQRSFVGEHGNCFTEKDIDNSPFGNIVSGKTNDNLKEKENAGRRNEDIADKV